MGITLKNCGILQHYYDLGVSATFTSEDGQVATGYVKGFWLSAYGRKSEYIEIGESPNEGGFVISPSRVIRVEPLDLEKVRESLLEKHSSADAEKILSTLTVSF